MSPVSQLELDHCNELALLPGGIFEFTSRYVPSGSLEPLLALYALKQAVSTIPFTAVDDAVKWAKLKWWSEEFAADPASSSRHPVLRALKQSGARPYLTDLLLQRLISDAIMQVDAVPDSDEKAMFDRFSILGATEIQLELALDSAEIEVQGLEYLAAASSLFRLVSRLSVNHQCEAERIPLGLLAKYNVSPTQLQQTSNPKELARIISQLCECGLVWFSRGMTGLEMIPDSGACSHLQLRLAMEERRLRVIRKDPAGFLESRKLYGPADAWFAWRLIRRLK